MAFIRHYQQRSYALGSLAGDPGLGKFFKRAFTPPKAIRKLQVGKALGNVAKVALPIFGGPVGALAAGLLPSGGGGGAAPARAARMTFGEMILQHLAAQGFPVFEEAGDPFAMFGGGRSTNKGPSKPVAKAAPKPPKKRQKAAQTPKTKAETKKQFDVGAALQGATDFLGGLLGTTGGQKMAESAARKAREMLGGPFAPLPADLGIIPQMPGGSGGTFRMPGMRGRRRTMNPTNIKALRRGLRRIESFNKVVKSVHKTLPRLAPAPGRPTVRGRKR